VTVNVPDVHGDHKPPDCCTRTHALYDDPFTQDRTGIDVVVDDPETIGVRYMGESGAVCADGVIANCHADKEPAVAAAAHETVPAKRPAVTDGVTDDTAGKFCGLNCRVVE
jgi:hypothetical protein